MTFKRTILAITVTSILISGCADKERPPFTVNLEPTRINFPDRNKPVDNITKVVKDNVTAKKEIKIDNITIDNSSAVLKDNKTADNVSDNQTVKDNKKQVSLTFDAADVYEVISTIFGEIIRANYIVDPSVNNKVTFSINGRFTKEETLELVAKALDVAGIAMINKNDTYFISKKTDMKTHIPYGENPNIYSIDVFQLENIQPDYFMKNIQLFVSPGAAMFSMPSINSVIIADRKENIANIKRILAIIDSKMLDGILFKIVPVRHIKSEEAAAVLNEIIKSNEVVSKPGFARDTYITSLKTNNSLLVLSRNENMFRYIVNWLEELDQVSKDERSNVYVYYVENAKAKDVGNILSQLYGGTSSTSSTGTTVVPAVTGKSDSTSTSSSSSTSVTSTKISPSKSTDDIKGEVKIITDEVNNAIIIKARADDYSTIKKVLKDIDVVPRQVLIDVLVAEVSYNDKMSIGVQWFLKSYGMKIGDVKYSGNAFLNEGVTLPKDVKLGASSIMGFAYGLYNPLGDLRALFSALGESSNINILSAPNILAIDNKKAKIEVGQDVPTITQTMTSSSSDSNVTNTVQYKNSGIILEVEPHINSSGLVRLDIIQEISEAKKNTTSGIDSPIFLKRKAETSLVVENGQTIVIGGLIQEKKDFSDAGIPFLKDIPIIGYIFGGKEKTKDKIELVIAITPHVINTKDDVKAMTIDFMSRVEEVKKIIGDKLGKDFKQKLKDENNKLKEIKSSVNKKEDKSELSEEQVR